MQFFAPFRQSLKQFAEGVHRPGDPASEEALRQSEQRLGLALSSGYRDFLRQWNGAWLFHETIAIYGVAGAPHGLDGIERIGDELALGVMEQDSLLLTSSGRLVAVDPETERRLIVGSSFERWLAAILARDALLYQRDGEFREEAFVAGEISPRTAERRARVAIKADGEAAAWSFELGRLLADKGDAEEARACYARATTLDRGAAEIWFALGELEERLGREGDAVEAYRRAAEVEENGEEAAYALARAAGAARRAGHGVLADELALACRERDAGFVEAQLRSVRHLLSAAVPDEEEIAMALERLVWARAVAPHEDEASRLEALLRSRLVLRAR